MERKYLHSYFEISEEKAQVLVGETNEELKDKYSRFFSNFTVFMKENDLFVSE